MNLLGRQFRDVNGKTSAGAVHKEERARNSDTITFATQTSTMVASLKQPVIAPIMRSSAPASQRSSRHGDARWNASLLRIAPLHDRSFAVVRLLAWLQAMMCALCMVLLVLDASVPQQHNAIARGRRGGPGPELRASPAYTAALTAARVCVLLLDMSGLFLAVALLRLLPIGASTQGQSINAPGRGGDDDDNVGAGAGGGWTIAAGAATIDVMPCECVDCHRSQQQQQQQHQEQQAAAEVGLDAHGLELALIVWLLMLSAACFGVTVLLH